MDSLMYDKVCETIWTTSSKLCIQRREGYGTIIKIEQINRNTDVDEDDKL